MEQIKIKLFLSSLFLIYAHSSSAELSLDGLVAVGLPTISIENTDGTKAEYSGLSFKGKLFLNFYENRNRNIKISATSSLRKYSLENDASNSSITEKLERIDYGLGANILLLSKFNVGIDVYFSNSEHNFSGARTSTPNYDTILFNYYIDYEHRLNQWLLLSAGYSISQGKVPGDELGHSGDLDFNEGTFWFSLRISYQRGGSGRYPRKNSFDRYLESLYPGSSY